MRKPPPFRSLDIFRGFAAIWVVMTHACDRWLPANPAYLHQPLYAFASRGQLGVTLFFVISGYCITAAAYGALVSGKSTGRYAFERIRRIYPPYLAALLISTASALTILFALNHHLIGEVHHLQVLPATFKFWFANLTLLQSELNTAQVNIVFWSLGYEVVFYAVIGLFLWIAKLIARRSGLSAAMLFFICAIGLSTAATLGCTIVTGIAFFPMDWWHQFSLGGLLFCVLELKSEPLKPNPIRAPESRLRQAAWFNFLLSVALTLLLIAPGHLSFLHQVDAAGKLRSLVCLGFLLLLIALRPVDLKLSANPLAYPLMWLGAFSYSLYLIHPVVLPYVDMLGRRLHFDGPHYWLSFWMQVAVAILFGKLFYLAIEKHFISKRQVSRLIAEHVA